MYLAILSDLSTCTLLLYQIYFLCTFDAYSLIFISVSLYSLVWLRLMYLWFICQYLFCVSPLFQLCTFCTLLLYSLDVYFPCIPFCAYVFSVEIMYNDVFYTDYVIHLAFHYMAYILVRLLVIVGDPMLLLNFRLSVRTVGGFGHRMCVAGRIRTPSGVGSSHTAIGRGGEKP